MQKKAIVLGAGSAGLIAAKELTDVGIAVTIIEANSNIGGIWSTLPWKTYTLTSSKWVTEFGCYPMPDDFPDFVTNEHMLRYLESFVDHFELRPHIEFNRRVFAIEKNGDGSLNVRTDQQNYPSVDFVVISTGLHGKPFTPDYKGVAKFEGDLSHSSEYRDPSRYKGKKTLCVGLGESGVGLVSELAGPADKLLVSSEGVAVAPRVVKGSQNPFDQMQFWQVGRHMIGYQEVLTSGLSWYYRSIPKFLKKLTVTQQLTFYSDYGPRFEEFEKWMPKALVPNHFHVKFWAKPSDSTYSGNLTRRDAPPDDLFYLIKTKKIIPKGRVQSFDAEGAFFEDGSYESVDSVVFNTGYKPASNFIEFPEGWQYSHSDLYKGCIHPSIPNLAFIGMVRPTIGSIPAMAEMHARIVAGYFGGSVDLPGQIERTKQIATDNEMHLQHFPEMHHRFPHIYFFDEWMERMSGVIGAKPRIRDHLKSLTLLKAYFFGAPMPLRYRMRGPGRVLNAKQKYINRVNKIWGNGFGKWAGSTVLIHFIAPYLLSLLVFLVGVSGFGLSMMASGFCAGCFYLLYRYVDLFRYILEAVFARPLSLAAGLFFIRQLKQNRPDYGRPEVFQSDS